MVARRELHMLEDLCEEQNDAMQEWLDTAREQPPPGLSQAERDGLVARARDVIEHIQRVVHQVRRMEQGAESAVQIHFSAQSNRTNDIMRTLTALTAIFLPLNLITGIFGMNFDVHAAAARPGRRSGSRWPPWPRIAVGAGPGVLAQALPGAQLALTAVAGSHPHRLRRLDPAADLQDAFPAGDSHLQRYAQVFDATEINSSFHRPHRPATYERWARSVAAGFAFSAKLPKRITHEARLLHAEAALDAFLQEAAGLGAQLQCLLVQLPPSLGFDAAVAAAFVTALRQRHAGPVALEPRHASWFTPEVDAWLAERRIARVLADPVRHAAGPRPGGWPGLVYLRLHGSPRVYYSSYPDDVLEALALRLRQAADGGAEVWCIFDNTAGQAAAGNALTLRRLLAQTKGG